MPPIDHGLTRVAFALAEWRGACGKAKDALMVKTKTVNRLLKEAIEAAPTGTKVTRTDISRLETGQNVPWPPPKAEICEVVDELCKKHRVGPFNLVALREAWEDAKESAEKEPNPRRFRIQVGVPPLPAVSLQPRLDLQKQLHKKLKAAPTGPAVLTQVAAGNGGMGKTQLARTLWDEAQADGCHVLVWVPASQRASIISSFADAALEAELPGIQPDSDREWAATQFRAWLGSTPMNWLVVFDGVVDPEHIIGLMPEQSDRGRLIVTTRRRNLRLPGAVRVEVGAFSAVEARSYLASRLSDPEARTDALTAAHDLADELGNLPLALAQAASYVVRKGLTCADYVIQFRNRSKTVLELFPELDRADEYALTVATAWGMAVDAADVLEPSGLATPAIELAAMLDPNGIPQEIWTGEVGRNYLAANRRDPSVSGGLAAAAMPSIQPEFHEVGADQALQALRNLHLFSVLVHNPNPDAGLNAVVVHSLVQRSTRDELRREHRIGGAAYGAADALDAIWPEEGFDNDLMRNVNSLLAASGAELFTGEVHLLVFHAGLGLASSGQSVAARDYFNQQTQSATKHLGATHPDTLSLKTSLAALIGAAGDAARAVSELDVLARELEDLLGTADVRALTARAHAAKARGDAGDPAGAVREFDEVIPKLVRELGKSNKLTLAARNNRAQCLGQSGDLTRAVAELDAVIPDLKALGPKNELFYMARDNLASLHVDLGLHDRALADREQLYLDASEALGDDHPVVIGIRSNLILSRPRDADGSGLLAALDDVFQDAVKVFGDEDPRTLRVRKNLTAARKDAGVASSAEIDAVINDHVRLLGIRHQTLQAMIDLAEWPAGLGPSDETDSDAALTKIIALVRKYAPHHPETPEVIDYLERRYGRRG